MENSSQSERKKSVLGAITASKLTEMLKNIDISSIKEANGGYNARARILALFDMGTFAETGAYIVRQDAGDDPSNAFEGVITGYGAIDGRLVYAFVQDSSRMKGAFDSVSAGKITSLINLAIRNGAPVVGIFDSCGASVYEGAKVLAAYGRIMKSIFSAKGIVPLVALIPGVCGGGMAAFASAFDFVLCVRNQSEFYVAPQFISGETPADGSAIADIISDSEDELYIRTRELLALIPSNCNEGARLTDTPVLERMTPPELLLPDRYDAKKLAASLADEEIFLEIRSELAPELVAGLAFVGGVCCGIMANQPSVRSGMMTASACRKAERLVRFCDEFGLPLIALANCGGICSEESDSAEYASAIADLYSELTLSENAKISAVTGNAYGIGFTLMASKSVGGDVAFALVDSCISAMSPEASVAFVWNDRICSNEVTVTREQLEREWREKLASPNDAALCGQIDDIIEPSELRTRIVSAVRMLSFKSRGLPTPRREGRRSR